MPAPPRTPTTFLDVLEQVWWRLDTALDLEMLEWSAKLGALEALEAGCTAIIDHHESPNAIEGSLSVIADACAEVGVRVNTCYGVTDRHGADGARRGLEENDRFLREGGRRDGRRARRVHLHRRDAGAAADLAARHGVGVHVHVAEGPDDVDAADRLRALSTDEWLLIHGVHLPDDHGLRGTIVHNPRSNMNNAVGYARPSRFANPVAFGTDGIGADMIAEFQLAFVAARAVDVTTSPDTAWGWLETGVGAVPRGARRPGHVVVLADEPWHLAYTPGVRAIDVDIAGEPALRQGVAVRVDADEIRAKAAEQAARLHARL